MTVKDAIDVYLNKGFGSMNKSDFELWIFNEWISDHLHCTMSNYEISRELRLPESKVKKLRYEADLKYGNGTPEKRNEQIIALLEGAHLKRNGTQIQFVVEDVSLRKYIDHLLKQNGYFADSSFNSEVVSLTIDDWGKLLELTTTGNIMTDLLAKAKKKLNKSDLTSRELLDIFIKKVVEGAGTALGGFTIAGITKLLGL